MAVQSAYKRNRAVQQWQPTFELPAGGSEMKMSWPQVSRAFIGLALWALNGCTDDPATQGVASSEIAAFTIVGAQPQTRLEEIGVGLASALHDPDTRAWLLNGISKSPYVERRIPLRQLLAADTSANLRTILRKSGRTFTAGQLAQLPDLELYIPVESHLAAASPNTPFQVAVRGSADSFYVIRPDGSAFRANEWFDPGAVVTVALGRSEIDYSDPASALRGGRNTGTGIRAAMAVQEASVRAAEGLQYIPFAKCNPEVQNCGGGGGTPPPPPSGGDVSRYTGMAYLELTKHMEGIAMGLNEIEIFGKVNGAYASCGSITDVHYGIDYALLLPANVAYRVATAIPTGTSKFTLVANEDDNDRCVPHPDDDELGAWTTGITIAGYNRIWLTETPSLLYLSVLQRSYP